MEKFAKSRKNFHEFPKIVFAFHPLYVKKKTHPHPKKQKIGGNLPNLDIADQSLIEV